MSRLKTLNQIAEILSFTNNTNNLYKKIINKAYDWDTIVKISSQHLVLPTLYYRLKSKKLLDNIPEDLTRYLNEISTINQNRNKGILNEIQIISQLFIKNKISHVFLKGAAFIAANYYEYIGERMIGDIDILISQRDINKANQLLIDLNYIPAQQTFGEKYFEHKHLPRLRHKAKLAAVELHKTLLKKPYSNYLDPLKVLKDKKLTNNIYVPSPLNLLYHNALNYQINDKGSLYINFSFRSAFDCITLLNTHPEINLEKLSLNSEIDLYFQINSIHFHDILNQSKEGNKKFKLLIYYYKTRYDFFYKLWHITIKYFLLIGILNHRIIKFILNSDYRYDVINDRARVLQELKKY